MVKNDSANRYLSTCFDGLSCAKTGTTATRLQQLATVFVALTPVAVPFLPVILAYVAARAPMQCAERAADDDHVLVALLRQLLAGLLAHHVPGVPLWPVRVGLPSPRLVLPVRGRRTPKRALQIFCRR